VSTKDLVKEAHLSYSNDDKPGWTRKIRNDKFEYFDLDNKLIKDQDQIDRVNKLVIPPAWENVWICPSENGYLQATGRDARGRKQYRYHPKWNKKAQQEKFTRMLEFGRVLPKIRRKISLDMRKRGLPREKVLATIVWLLEKTLIRVGNEEYVKENNSYGLTTLRDRHVKVRGNKIKFAFKGKSGVYHNLSINNKKVAGVIRKCQDLPGQELFEYRDIDGSMVQVHSEDVNEYLTQISGQDITAKDFRTWAGTNLAAEMLDKQGLCDKEAEVKKIISDTVKGVSSHLRNRPATCRKYYIHPFIFHAYMSGVIISNHKSSRRELKDRMLTECEKQVLGMLKRAKV
jgi:DNA topoisomerase-1